MKATLEFNLPDDSHSFKLATEAQNLHSLLLECHQRIRSYLKHGVPEHESALRMLNLDCLLYWTTNDTIKVPSSYPLHLLW
jgi:hypothetical protein